MRKHTTLEKSLQTRFLEGKYSYVVTTHIDKWHVHNHIIFCAADNIEHNKYHDCKQSYYHIRKLSDELCKEHNLSIIIPGGERGKKYKEWQSDQNGSTWKTQLRQDMNFCIKSASTYEEFLLLMRAKGYEIKGETFGEDAAKYISFRPLDKEHFVRGSARSLGKEYTKKRIRERIEKKRERKAVIPKKDYSSRKIIDTSDEKFQNSPGLQQWAAIENLKIAAQSYNEAGSLSDLEHKITVKNEAGKSAKQSVVELEHRMKNLAEIIKYAEQYKDNRSYHIAYKKAKNPILLGVCIHENDIKPITNQIYKLKDSIYGKQDEIKSTKLIREATITKNHTNNKAYGEGMVDIITSYDAAVLP